MGILEAIGHVLTLNELAVAAMFLLFIFCLFRGIPVAFALVGVSLIFVLIAEILLDPHRSFFKDIIEFDRTGIDYRRLAAISGWLGTGRDCCTAAVISAAVCRAGLALATSNTAQGK